MMAPVFFDPARVLVVAEIGNNHEGDFALAQRLILEAARAGADAVKFQTARAERFIGASDPERLARFRSYEFTPEQWTSLAAAAREAGVAFISTPLDLESARMLDALVDAYKVASGDIAFLPLLDYLASTGKPIIVSTGASTEEEVRRAVERVRAARAANGRAGSLAVLHCVSAYPTPAAEANLGMIPRLAAAFDEVPVGYSDHVAGIDAAVAAVAAGAVVLEKHFTIDKAYSSFRDHALSAEPAEFAEMVRRVREVTAMLGTGEKVLQPAEAPLATAIRRSIAAARDLATGAVIAATDLMWVRPGSGLAPGQESAVIGRRVRRDVRRGELLAPTDFE